MIMHEMGIGDARPKLGEIIDRARFTGQPTLLTRQGAPGAVVVNADWYELAISFMGEFRPHLGRFEIIHKDGDPANNAPDNLELRERAS
jgi:prevent-host-death family protein